MCTVHIYGGILPPASYTVTPIVKLHIQKLTYLCDNKWTRFGSAFTYYSVFSQVAAWCAVRRWRIVYPCIIYDFQTLTGTSNDDGIQTSRQPWEGEVIRCVPRWRLQGFLFKKYKVWNGSGYSDDRSTQVFGHDVGTWLYVIVISWLAFKPCQSLKVSEKSRMFKEHVVFLTPWGFEVAGSLIALHCSLDILIWPPRKVIDIINPLNSWRTIAFHMTNKFIPTFTHV